MTTVLYECCGRTYQVSTALSDREQLVALEAAHDADHPSTAHPTGDGR